MSNVLYPSSVHMFCHCVVTSMFVSRARAIRSCNPCDNHSIRRFSYLSGQRCSGLPRRRPCEKYRVFIITSKELQIEALHHLPYSLDLTPTDSHFVRNFNSISSREPMEYDYEYDCAFQFLTNPRLRCLSLQTRQRSPQMSATLTGQYTNGCKAKYSVPGRSLRSCRGRAPAAWPPWRARPAGAARSRARAWRRRCLRRTGWRAQPPRPRAPCHRRGRSARTPNVIAGYDQLTSMLRETQEWRSLNW